MHIPGVLTVCEPSADDSIPVLVDSPHSGRDYPHGFQPWNKQNVLDGCEDRYVDRLIENFPSLGATTIVAHVPRIYIDLNRARNDISPKLINDEWTGEPLNPTDYSASGIGLIRDHIEKRKLYLGGLSSAEVTARIETYYDPYYDALKAHGSRLEKQFGRFYHLNMHSMPSSVKADIVLGNRFGASCSVAFTDMMHMAFQAQGFQRIQRNTPYAGAQLTQLFSDLGRKGESMQIEVNKALYLDGNEINPEKFAKLQEALEGVLKSVADYAATQKTSSKLARKAASTSSMRAPLPSAASDVTP